MEQIPDHPDIARCLCSGYAHPVRFPICPECGAETDEFYKDRLGDIVGCANCIESVDAWEETDGKL